ncbi:MAG: bifunctional glutamate N-acetyltransferase/amino-acid acetyltransferase ArgJ [Rhizobiaceae bacterium]
MSTKISPLAPKTFPDMPEISGVRMGSVQAGIKYEGRKDLTAFVFDAPTRVAGVLTKSKCPSAPVDWCRKILPAGNADCLIVNSGNANAFTGVKGMRSVEMTVQAAAEAFSCNPAETFIASTGVIGEPLDVSGFRSKLTEIAGCANSNGWFDAAQAIMTTDTYPKLAARSFSIGGETYLINGIAKGSGMIAPDMATMLAFLVTDLPIAHTALQKMLSAEIKDSFNAITVDGDTSTSDTVLLFSCGELSEHKGAESATTSSLKQFRQALREVLHELAMLVVRDGEGASKHVEISVSGAKSKASAHKIALAIANSPLVKTAIAGEDANWGRIVMAVGKAGEPADRDRLSVWFGDIRVAMNGERDPDYSEEEASAIMRKEYIPIAVDIGIGNGSATVWTCDLTAGYISINADYRS